MSLASWAMKRLDYLYRQVLRRMWARQAQQQPGGLVLQPTVIEALEPRTLLSATLAGPALGEAFAAVLAGEVSLDQINLDLPEEFRDSLCVRDWAGQRTMAVRDQWIGEFGEQLSAEQLQNSLQSAFSDWTWSLSPSVIRSLGEGQFLLSVPDALAADYDAMLGALEQIEGFGYLEPNMPLWSMAIPDDPRFSQLWGLHNTGQTGGTADADIDAPEAWDLHTGSGDVVVGIIDTGLDTGIHPDRSVHPDLAANLWTNPGEIAGDGIDNDGNGYIDDIHGWDFTDEDNDPQDGHGHGTHVAGTIAGVGNDREGIVGVNWSAQILPLKFLSDSGSGNTADAVEAMAYANSMRQMWLDSDGSLGANIRLTSNSWGGGAKSQALGDTISAARDLDMLFVVAAGNASNNNDINSYWPANFSTLYDNVIAVAATDHNDNLASFSSYGPTTVHLAAPGVSIYSSLPDGQYAAWSGTSMATPHVAGVAALAWSFDPAASYSEVKQAILTSVDAKDSLDGLVATGGRLNAFNALMELSMTVREATPGAGDVLTAQPTSFVLTFDDPFEPTSVDAGDLLVNDIAADSATVLGPSSVRFDYDTSPVLAEGLQSLYMAPGAVIRISDGRGSVEFASGFRYDVHRMAVSASDPAEGSLVALPMSSLTVMLDEDVVASSVSTEDLQISQGKVVGYEMLDARRIRFDLDFVFQEEQFVAHIQAGAFEDQYGNPVQAFTAQYQLDYMGIILPDSGLFDAIAPAGSMVYQYAYDGTIAIAGNEDEIGLALDPGQRLSVLATCDAQLRQELTLEDPNGVIVAQVIASQEGETLSIHAANIDTAGDDPYVLRIGGLDDTTGAYSLRFVLNGLIEGESIGGAANDTLDSAESIDPGFISLGQGQIVSVVGQGDADFARLVGPDGYGYAAVSVDYQWEDISTTAQKIIYPEEHISPADLGDFKFSFYGVDYNDIYFNDHGVLTFNSAYGRSQSPTDLAQVPLQATLAPYWNYWMGNGQGSQKLPDTGMYWEIRGQDTADERLIIQWNGMSMVNHNRPEIYFQTQLYADGRIQFNYDVIDYGHKLDGTSQATVGIKGVGTADDNRLLVCFHDVENEYVGNQQSVLISPDVAEPVFAGGDYYKMTLDAGESASFAARFNGGAGQIELYDPTGVRLAVGSTDVMPSGVGIASFVAPDAGEYVIRVLGGGEGVEYTLSASREGDYDFDRPGGLDEAQPLLSSMVVGWAGRPELAPENYGALRVLYYEDSYYGHSIGPLFGEMSLDQAVGVDKISEFVSQLSSQAWDLVVVNQQMWNHPQWVPYIESHLASGGSAVLFDWTGHAVEGADFRSAGWANIGNIVKSAGQSNHPIWQGVDSISPQVGIYSIRSWAMEPTGDGYAVGSFTGDWDLYDGIVIGADGRSIMNGWVYDTVDLYAAETMLENQILYTLQSAFAERDDWYSVQLQAGEVLNLWTQTPASGEGEFVNTLDPTLEIYDASGTLLGSDENGLDGLNAAIEYTAASAGVYYIRVTGATGEGNYVLHADSLPAQQPTFEVVTTTPADGEMLAYRPREISIDLSDSVLLTTLEPGDILINALPAENVQISDGDTINFTIPSSLGDGEYTISIAAGAFSDTQGTPVEAYSWSFRADASFPTVAATSVTENALVSPGPLSLEVTFSEPINPASLSSEDFILTGSTTGQTVLSNWSYDANSATLTLEYASLQEDFYTLRIASGDMAVEDLVGYDLDGNADGIGGDPFFLHFSAGVASEPFPALTSVAPLGSMIYGGADNGALASDGSKAYTLNIDAGQLLSARLGGNGGLRGQIRLIAPDSTLLASASADIADGEAVLSGVLAQQAGQYLLVVDALDATAGGFSLEVLLNAVFETPTDNDTQAAAGELVGLEIGSGRVHSVRGSLSDGQLLATPNAFGHEAMLTAYQWEDIVDTGTLVIEGTGTTAWEYVDLGDFSFPFYDQSYSAIGIHQYGALNFADGILKSSAWSNTNLGSSPTAGTIAPLWDHWDFDIYGSDIPEDHGVYYDIRGEGASRRLIVQWHRLAHGGVISNGEITFQAILYQATGDLIWNYKDIDGTLSNINFNYYGASSTIGIKDSNSNGADELVLYYGNGNDNTPAPWMDNEVAVRLGRYVRDLADWYRIDLQASQRISAVLSASGAAAPGMKLYDAGGTLLATASAGADNVDSALVSYLSSAEGTYYIQVAEGSGEYSLVLLEDAGFELEPNSDSSQAGQAVADTMFGYIDPADGDVEDWYRFEASAGTTIELSTDMLGSGEGEFTNFLDPRLELYGPDGSLLASDDNAGPGANAMLSLVAPLSGEYRVRVFSSDAGTLPQPGLVADYYLPSYSGSYLSDFPDWDAYNPVLTKVNQQVSIFDLDGQGTGFDGTEYINNFAVQWNGYVHVQDAGNVTFYVNSDDGSRLYINDQLVVNNGGPHGFVEKSGSIALSAGYHAVRLDYFEAINAAGIELSWQLDDGSKELVPAGALFQAAPLDASSGEYILSKSLTPPYATIQGQHVFYNNSHFDGDEPAATASDDAAVAGNKHALEPGQQATSDNYTSYSKGINGILIDINGLVGIPDAADFVVRFGQDGDPAGWVQYTPSVSLREGDGENGSDRVTLIFPDGQMVNGWVQVTVLANERTGLAEDDVFYFGNLAGDFDGDMDVDDDDATRILQHYRMSDVAIEDGDINADGMVNLADIREMRDSFGLSLAGFSAPEPETMEADIVQGDSALLLSEPAFEDFGSFGALGSQSDPEAPVLAPRPVLLPATAGPLPASAPGMTLAASKIAGVPVAAFAASGGNRTAAYQMAPSQPYDGYATVPTVSQIEAPDLSTKGQTIDPPGPNSDDGVVDWSSQSMGVADLADILGELDPLTDELLSPSLSTGL